MSVQAYNDEFDNAFIDIIYKSTNIADPLDRIRICEWIRKIYFNPNNTLEDARIRNEYMQYLRIILNTKPVYFSNPFKGQVPKDNRNLIPLPELLGNLTTANCPLSKTGPLQPALCHKTEDGNAFMTVKRCPLGGIFCYMAVAPNNVK